MARTLFTLAGLVVFLVTNSCSNGTTSPPAATTSAGSESQSNQEVATTIEQLEREWVTAIVKNDQATLSRLLSDDFVGTSPTAHIYHKKEALSDLQSGTYVVTSMNLDEVSANVYGDTAVAFTSQEEQSSYAGQDVSGHYHYTDVWVRRDGQWHVVASHGSCFDQPH